MPSKGAILGTMFQRAVSVSCQCQRLDHNISVVGRRMRLQSAVQYCRVDAPRRELSHPMSHYCTIHGTNHSLSDCNNLTSVIFPHSDPNSSTDSYTKFNSDAIAKRVAYCRPNDFAIRDTQCCANNWRTDFKWFACCANSCPPIQSLISE